MNKGKFIVIDGLDGSGKTTQTKLLVDYLKKQKRRVEVVDFPQYYKSFFGRLTGRYLKGEFGNLEQTNPYLACLPFAADRWEAKPVVNKALKQGKLLLANRYTPSMVYMAAKFNKKSAQEKFLRWVRELEYQTFGIPKEDLVIYLSVPPKVGQRLVLNKGNRKYMGNKKKHDIHEANIKYLETVERIYLDLVKRFDHWEKIECLDKKNNLKTIPVIHREVLRLLKKKNIV